jgi:hypothetical protein
MTRQTHRHTSLSLSLSRRFKFKKERYGGLLQAFANPSGKRKDRVQLEGSGRGRREKWRERTHAVLNERVCRHHIYCIVCGEIEKIEKDAIAVLRVEEEWESVQVGTGQVGGGGTRRMLLQRNLRGGKKRIHKPHDKGPQTARIKAGCVRVFSLSCPFFLRNALLQVDSPPQTHSSADI